MRHDDLNRHEISFPLQGTTVVITNGLDATFDGETVRLSFEQLGELLQQSEHEHDLVARGASLSPVETYTEQYVPDFGKYSRLCSTLSESKAKHKAALKGVA